MKKKDVMVLSDPEVVKVATETTRRNILALLRVNDLSISQLAEMLGKDQSTVYRHVKKLEKYGLIKVVGERKVHHIPEAVYGRVAKAYIIMPEIEKNMKNSVMYYKRATARNAINAIKAMDYRIENERIFSRDFFRFLNKLDKLTTEDWKNIEEKNIELDNRTFVNTFLLLTLIKINEDPELKDYMEEIGELIKRKR
jgi:DNA-binding transcriptional ArsR family regulator